MNVKQWPGVRWPWRGHGPVGQEGGAARQGRSGPGRPGRRGRSGAGHGGGGAAPGTGRVPPRRRWSPPWPPTWRCSASGTPRPG